jgi:hypothetical protein
VAANGKPFQGICGIRVEDKENGVCEEETEDKGDVYISSEF